ncbi:(E2-independent) E3 ubiquitin-conjugating enzyme FATS [Chiloscyllium plagiosum]|uniref:(E2-independent) E3 ubiquitin-conjugating enzyme FATS n=1 Tax=Chiloscyllium plagiosum TaxID=36176 RepID=UPI001CB84C7E|nr:(E2-independent) E3 ubiquitin-conjugating enzyme FATS [Chiloscyllium plagiosum]XP_043568543.1 (E2-independent) E3 ubiquitin-conjugating enzyme FATS [Chiloscyllium plagiosum]
MELFFQQVPATDTDERSAGNYWEIMMSQVKVLPSSQFMGNNRLENLAFKIQNTQRRFMGDYKKRAASPASQTASMPELSSEHFIHTPSLNSQNGNDRFSCKKALNQYYSGFTKCSSNLNYSDIPLTAHGWKIQESSVYKATNSEIAFDASIEKVRIKDFCMQKKECVTVITSDTVKYHQLPKRSIVSIYTVDENYDNNNETRPYTKIEKVNIPFSSVPNNNRLSTKNENSVVQALSEETGNNTKTCFFIRHSHFRAPRSELYVTSSKDNAMISSALITLAIREEASKDHSYASSNCLQHTQPGHSHQLLSKPNVKTLYTPLSKMPDEENILDSTTHWRKDRILTKSRKGFSSITITARKLISPVNNTSKQTVSSSPNEKNPAARDRSVKVLKNFKSCKGIAHIHSPTDNANEFLCDGYTAAVECSEPRSALHSTEDRPSSLKIDSRHPEILLLSNNGDKTHLLAQQFHSSISFSHFDVLPQCFKSTYYLDKPFLVDLCSVTNNGLKQKTTLSFKLNCTSSISSADGGNGTVKLIPFTEISKQKVDFNILDQKTLDASLTDNDCIREQKSTPQKECKSACQCNGYVRSAIKGAPRLPKESAHFFFSLSNMKKGMTFARIDQKCKCHQQKMQHSFFEIVTETDDITFPNNHVDLIGKRKDIVKQGRQKSTFRMIAKSTTRSPIVHQGENNNVSQSQLNTECEKTTLQLLTLREALEMYKPDFISRSQKRVQQLEVKAKRRKVQLTEPMELQRKRMESSVQNMPFSSPIKKRQCTIPHPLSDNLFKPKERMIPEKEMQMRSKRIYNMLPEVKRKKEEEKKKIISQTNRLRAELFKKKLLDQILQRTNDNGQESA